jgi:transposase
MSAMPKTRPPYPPEFRREAVQLVRSGHSVKDVAESLGCSDQSLHLWVKRDQLDRHEREDGLTTDEREELRKLRRARTGPDIRATTRPRERGLSSAGEAAALLTQPHDQRREQPCPARPSAPTRHS